MDKQLSAKNIRRNQFRKYRWIAASVVLLLVIFFIFQSILKPTIKINDVRTSIVDMGSIEATISARGTIVPELETVINSSINSKILEVYHRSGDLVKKGDAILLLDMVEINNEHEKMLEEIQLKDNEFRKKQLEFNRALSDLITDKSLKELSLKNSKSDVKAAKILEEMGGGTREQIEQTEFNLKKTEIELDRLIKKIEQQKFNIEIEANSTRIEKSIQDKKLKELEKKIELASVKAQFDGVITSVKEELGARVSTGEIIANLADLSSYKINCSISDIHSSKIRLGGSVIIGINDIRLRGAISQVSAGLTGGEVKFKVTLEDSGNSILKPNLEVDVYVITSHKGDVIRVRNGGFYNGSKECYIFKVNSNKIKKEKIETGVSNFEYVEIVSGLSAGDKIIISDMQNELKHETLSIEE